MHLIIWSEVTTKTLQRHFCTSKCTWHRKKWLSIQPGEDSDAVKYCICSDCWSHFLSINMDKTAEKKSCENSMLVCVSVCVFVHMCVCKCVFQVYLHMSEPVEWREWDSPWLQLIGLFEEGQGDLGEEQDTYSSWGWSGTDAHMHTHARAHAHTHIERDWDKNRWS